MVRTDHGTQPAGPSRLPIFGRERELDMLRSRLDAACHGSGGLVLVSGEAGIGKTSLVRAISQIAAEHQVPVHTSACYDLSVTPPYRPWIEIFTSMGTRLDPPMTATAAHEPAFDGITSQDALFGEAIDNFTRAAAEQPRLLVLEDFHWADSASLEFLRYAGRQIGEKRALIVVTYRDNEIDRQHPFHQHLPALVRESGATRVSLRPLDEPSIDAMIQQRFELPVPDHHRLLAYLLRRTEGNPFFIEELLRALEENDVITQRSGHWELSDLRQVPVPALIRQIIDNRVSQLDPAHRYLLSVAAAIGQDVSLDIWQQVGSADDATLAATVQDAIRLSILEESTTTGTMQFTHALVREALYHENFVPQRRSLHQAIAEALRQAPATDPDAIAYHLQQAQDPRAPEWLVIAGERAQQLYAWRTAAERIAAALEFLGENESQIRVRAWLSYRIGLLLTYADAEEGISRMQEAEQGAAESGDELLRAYARADRGLLRCLTGDVRRGLAELRSGVEAIDVLDLPGTGADEDGQGPLTVDSIQRGTFQLLSSADDINARQGPLVFWLAWAGRYEDALAVGEPFVEQASALQGNINDALGDGLAGLGHALAALGRPEESLAAFARARDTFGAIDHHFKVGNTAIYELSEAFLPYRVDRIMEREWLADQAENY